MSKSASSRYLSSLAALVCLAAALHVRAAGTVYYASDTDLVLSGFGTPLKIMAGSAQEGLTLTATGFTVTVGEGEAFVVRLAGPNPNSLENDGLLPPCNVLTTRENQILIRGPRTVTVTPGPVACSTANYSTNTTPQIGFIQPVGGGSFESGDPVQVFWQSTGNKPALARIRLSTDGGASFPLAVAENLMNNGFYQWTVPAVTTTDRARLKIDGLSGSGEIVATAVSAAFAIEGIPPEEPPAPPAYDYDEEAATFAASTIDADKGFSLPPGSPEPPCAAGLRLKGASSPAVYFCGADGRRHAFPNQKIHDSWYAGDFAGVVTVSDAVLAAIPLGANVTYRPGVRMVKIQTDPKVYAVAANGTLRWVPSEAAAEALYGAGWNQMIDDVPDSFFTDYTTGEPISLK